MTAVILLPLFVGLYLAWSIGANDVANAMGTSVGSGSITFRQAAILAGVAEFASALLVGSHVSHTIEAGIVDPSFFEEAPMDLVCGMLAAMLAAGIWVHISSFLGQPVSTTHSIVGGVCGFGIAAGARIFWAKEAVIALSWVLSPVAGAGCAFLLFRFIAKRILGAERPLEAGRRIAPRLVACVFFILVLSFIYKGLKNVVGDVPIGTALAISAGVGLAMAIAAALLVRHFGGANERPTIEGDLAQVERIFRCLQILTACYVAFAHGANDVANAVGPMAAVIELYAHRAIPASVEAPMWMLAVGGAGIVLGLATYGRRVIATIGTRLSELTPSRGFSAEFATATTVLACSKLGLPISTSHTIVGAVLGVALARGIESANPRVVRDIVACWVITVPLSGFLSAVIFLILRPIFT